MSNELNDVWWRLSDSETLWQWRHKDQPSKAEKGFHEFLYQSIIIYLPLLMEDKKD